MLLLSHPTGNANVRAAARAFSSVGWLQEFDSCICWKPDSLLANVLPSRLKAQLGRRSFSDIPIAIQHSYPLREVGRLLIDQLPLSRLRRLESSPFSIDAIYRSFDRHVASRLHDIAGLQAVYGYEWSSFHTFRKARSLGLRCIYELPIGYWRAAREIFQEEAHINPEWASSLTGLQDSATKQACKDQELNSADLVIVASEYVRTTLVAYNACSAPIAVVPYGAPPPLSIPPPTSYDGPLRVLYVGSLGQRKGLSYALDAVSALGDQVTLTLIGKPTAPDCVPLQAALQRHHWIRSLPHPQILHQMRCHDVLLFPTLFDGFGLVITEALSQGLPVITTRHSGGPECIRDGVEGFIVPIRDSNAIAERLQQLIENRHELARMRMSCLHRASEMAWGHYEQGLRSVVTQAFFKDSFLA
jgi:starch synthase